MSSATISPFIFREYDIRGIAGKDLTEEVALNIGKAFGTVLKRDGKQKVVIGHDHRWSAEFLFRGLSAGLQSCGLTVMDIGLVPTPLIYFYVTNNHLDAGVSLTGSHNPPDENGFKFQHASRSFYGKEIQGLRQLIEKQDFVSGKGVVERLDHEAVVRSYQDFIAKDFHFKKKLKVVIDTGHGMAAVTAPALIRRLGCDVTVLFENLDPKMPDHQADPSVPSNMKDLQKKVVEMKADIGIAFDGDADRLGVVDEKGKIIYGDKLLLLYAREILTRKPGAIIIGDVKSSKQVYDDIAKRGGKPIMWKTGHSLIKAKMKETGAEMAGEMSGHMFFKDRWLGFDDAVYAACRILEIADKADGPFSSLLADVPDLCSTPEIRVDCPDAIKFRVVGQAVADLKKKYEVVDIDGARVQFPDGWGLVRASNTQPVLVMRFEAKTESRLAEIRAIIENEIKRIMQEIR
ncbi:MAG TPA: phosphomannomutase/phosphoglucomutase [Candidatus Omnitrophota bacterium]|nr:phosphomannomutase/phosphoglucomutase [Candidatus Omnitrophota bacterium]